MNKVNLVSSDGQSFVVDRVVAERASTVNMLLQDIIDEDSVTLPNVSGKCLKKIIELCAVCEGDDEISKTNIKKLVVPYDTETLFDVLLAANYMDIPVVLDTMCSVVADKIKGKSPEEIRQTFDIKSDWDEEEYARVRKEYSWAFED